MAPGCHHDDREHGQTGCPWTSRTPPTRRTASSRTRLGAVVLTGGTAVRMDGVDKAVDRARRRHAARAGAGRDDDRGRGRRRRGPGPDVAPGDLDRRGPARRRPGRRAARRARPVPAPPGPRRGARGRHAPRLARHVRPPGRGAWHADVDGAVLLDDGRAPAVAVRGLPPRRRSRRRGRPEPGGRARPARRTGCSSGLRLVEVPAVDHEADDVDTWVDLRELRQDREERDRRTR